MSVQELPSARPTQPWRLPLDGLALFEGDSAAPRLSHYFLPGLVLSGKRVLFLDGANCADPRLMARLARQRNIPFAEFSRRLQIARAFTCFQFTELIARVPQFISGFRAEVLIVTAFPELYFDQDIRDWDARAAFEQALRHLRCWACQREPPLAVAVFTSSARPAPSAARRGFLPGVRASATALWRFEAGPEGKLALLPGPRESTLPSRAAWAETPASRRSVR
ncbi:MAG: hypothetical protein KGM47_09365 [Acidobacteriota bacterium]|nr:hypothetical protein [Acidobacteriota bacterium]